MPEISCIASEVDDLRPLCLLTVSSNGIRSSLPISGKVSTRK